MFPSKHKKGKEEGCRGERKGKREEEVVVSRMVGLWVWGIVVKLGFSCGLSESVTSNQM